jgi:hypothetical protein
MPITTRFGSMELLAIKTVLQVATVMMQVAAEVRGAINSLFANGAYAQHKAARPLGSVAGGR